MSEFFLKIVNMSISASWLVLAVLLLRLILKKAPKWVSVLLWGLVAVRLICPFSIESVLSLIPSAETVSPEIMMDWTPEISTGIDSFDAVVNPIITESFAPQPMASANPLQILIPVCGMIWILGIGIMLIYTAVSYLLLRRKVATAVVLRQNIYQSENVASPFVLGIIKPKIYLPFQIDSQNLEHVVAHEQAHIRRKDHLWKPFGFLLLAIHWFNPLMWLGYIFLCKDIELACDEKVIEKMDSESKADYTQALVACSVNRRSIAACPLAFGEVGVKARVKSILHYKKPAFWIMVAAIVVCAVVAVCFLTDPKSDANPGQAETIVGNLKTYYKNPDGTWQCDGRTYPYRLELTGKLSEPSRESGFIVLSNTETLSFAQIQPVLLSGNSGQTEDTILVEWLHPVANDLSDFEKPPEGDPGKKLTLDYVVMLSKRGAEISWEDFQNFTGHPAASGFNIMRYNIDGHLYMLVGEDGVSDNPYAMLCCTHLYNAGVDINSPQFKEYLHIIHQSEGSSEVFYGNLKTYYKNADGTWRCGGRNYKYRLVITGRMNNAAVDSTFVYLSNLETITFDQAWKAAGLSSHTADYFTPEEAVLVDWPYQGDTEEPLDNDQQLDYAAIEGFVTPESVRSGIPWRIHLTKQRPDPNAYYNLSIVVDTGAKVLKEELEPAVIPITDGSIYLGDIDGDQVQEIIVHDDTGGLGGFGIWQVWVLKVENNQIRTLFETCMEFDTGFESRFLEGHQLEVTNRFTGYKQIFDATIYKEYIDGSDELPDGCINVDPFYVFQPKDMDGDGISEIICKQYTYILDHTDYTGTVSSVLKFNKKTQSFDVVDAWFEINAEPDYSTPIRPEQITGVAKATLELPRSWDAPRTVTDPETLRKIEGILQRSEVLERGAGCLFGGRLTLTLTNGETLILTMSQDNCATWLSEGVYYTYSPQVMNQDATHNDELYDLFTAQ